MGGVRSVSGDACDVCGSGRQNDGDDDAHRSVDETRQSDASLGHLDLKISHCLSSVRDHYQSVSSVCHYQNVSVLVHCY